MKKFFERTKKNLKSQRGSEILQVVLVAGILLVLIVTIFYPQMEKLLNSILETISNWFTNTGSAIFK